MKQQTNNPPNVGRADWFRRQANLLTLLIAGCGGGAADSADPVRIPTSSPQLLAEAPQRITTGTLNGRRYVSLRDAAVLEFHDLAGVEEAESVDFDGAAILCARLLGTGDDAALFVAVLRADEKCSVFLLMDQDEDGVPDGELPDPLFTTPTPMFVTDLDLEPETGTLYFLDSRCQDVWRVSDTDDDQVPDELGSTAFAMSASFEPLVDVVQIIASSSDLVFGYTVMVRGNLASYLDLVDPVVMEDLTGNGIADSIVVASAMPARPAVTEGLLAGSTTLQIRVRKASATDMVQIWALDEDGADVSMLGSASLQVDQGVGEAAVTLSRPLAQDDRIAVRFEGEAGTSSVFRIAQPGPTIRQVEPFQVLPDTITSLTIRGREFTDAMSLHLRLPDGVVVGLSYTFVDSSEITCQVPAIPAPSGFGIATLTVVPPTGEFGTSPEYPLAVCEEELAGEAGGGGE